jgi:hypothetical protein
MAVLLDGTGLSPGTRTGRWLQALLTPQSILGFLPAASVVGLPLSFVVADSYASGKARYYGIPEELVRVGPADAVAPFIVMALLAWVFFVAAHEVERAGLAAVVKLLGGYLRVCFAGLWIGALITNFDNFVREEGFVLTSIVYAVLLVMAYVVLWWIPSAISWIGLRLGRAIVGGTTGAPPPGRFARHIFRGLLDYPKPRSRRLLTLYVVVALSLGLTNSVPVGIGWLEARWREDFPVIIRAGRPQKQVILAVYGDKTYTAEVEGQRIRRVMMRQTADLKDVEVRVEHLGQLRPAP